MWVEYIIEYSKMRMDIFDLRKRANECSKKYRCDQVIFDINKRAFEALILVVRIVNKIL